MSKTIRRWLMTAVIGIPVSLTLLWNAPRVVNGDYWWAGFLMDGVAIGFYVVSGVNIVRRISYSTSVAVLIHSETKCWVSTIDCLDVPYLGNDRIQELLAVYKENPVLFDSPVKLLEGSKK